MEDGSISETESEDSLQPVADAAAEDPAHDGSPDAGSDDSDDDLDKKTLIMGEPSPDSCASLAPGYAPPLCSEKFPDSDLKAWTDTCVDYLALHQEGFKEHPLFDEWVKHCMQCFREHGPAAAETVADLRHWQDWVFVQKREAQGVPRAPWLIEARFSQYMKRCPHPLLHAAQGGFQRAHSVSDLLYEETVRAKKYEPKVDGKLHRSPELETPQSVKALTDVLDSYTPPKIGIQTAP